MDIIFDIIFDTYRTGNNIWKAERSRLLSLRERADENGAEVNMKTLLPLQSWVLALVVLFVCSEQGCRVVEARQVTRTLSTPTPNRITNPNPNPNQRFMPAPLMNVWPWIWYTPLALILTLTQP